MRIFGENENRDIFMGADKQISIFNSLEATIQAVKSAIEIQVGEAVYATSRGIPTFATVWTGNPKLQQFEFFARRAISAVSGVDQIISFQADIDDDVLSYSTTIRTIYDEVTIDGSL